MNTDQRLSLMLLPAHAVAVLVLGTAANHAHAGALTQALFVLTVLAFGAQLWAAVRRA